MVLVQSFSPDDQRPSAILRLVGRGATGKEAAAAVGISRKTIIRWREQVPGFGEAYERAMELGRDGSAKARGELNLIIAAWTPGGIAAAELEPGPDSEIVVVSRRAAAAPEPEPKSTDGDPLEREPEWVRERVRAAMASAPVRAEPEVVEPDVLDAAGAEISVSGSRPPLPPAPYTTVRPPTLDEWISEMAALARDPEQPERVRVTAIAAVTSALCGGPGGRSTRPAHIDDATVAAAARGRDPGVPASVWQEARRSFLGPAPAAAPEDDSAGDVVELEQAKPG